MTMLVYLKRFLTFFCFLFSMTLLIGAFDSKADVEELQQSLESILDGSYGVVTLNTLQSVYLAVTSNENNFWGKEANEANLLWSLAQFLNIVKNDNVNVLLIQNISYQMSQVLPQHQNHSEDIVNRMKEVLNVMVERSLPRGTNLEERGLVLNHLCFVLFSNRQHFQDESSKIWVIDILKQMSQVQGLTVTYSTETSENLFALLAHTMTWYPDLPSEGEHLESFKVTVDAILTQLEDLNSDSFSPDSEHRNLVIFILEELSYAISLQVNLPTYTYNGGEGLTWIFSTLNRILDLQSLFPHENVVAKIAWVIHVYYSHINTQGDIERASNLLSHKVRLQIASENFQNSSDPPIDISLLLSTLTQRLATSRP